LKNAGLTIAGISVLPDVFKEVFAGEMQEKKDITSIICMGKRTTNISFFSGGEFEFNRELQIGGENISQAMVGIFVADDGSKIELTLEDAEKMKIESGVPLSEENYSNPAKIPFIQLQAMVRPALEKIQAEVSRTFEYYKGQSGEASINKIILTGGGALTPNLKEFLSEALGIPVISPKPIPDLDPRLIAAFGAATSGLGRINLLPDDVKYHWKTLTSRILKPYIVFPAVAAVLLIIYSLLSLYSVHLKNQSDFNTQKLNEYAPLLANFDVFQKAVQEEENRKKMLKAYGKTQKELPIILAEVSRLVPANIKIDMLTLSLKNIFLKGTAFEKGGAAENILAQFALSLSFSPILYEVRLNQAGKNENYKTAAIDFEITAKIKE
ncbi:MAG: pilus assembly protein PilM, partial [Candidatus Margulisiibacteriota bacterium]